MSSRAFSHPSKPLRTSRSRELGDAKIDAILLKGPDLALRFYGGLERRSFWDIDILVAAEVIDAAEAAFHDLGARRESPVFFTRAASRRHVHAFSWVFRGIEIDLHWATSEWCAHRLSFEALLQGSEVLDISLASGADTPLRVVGAEQALLLATLGFFRDAARGTPKLKQLIDVCSPSTELGHLGGLS